MFDPIKLYLVPKKLELVLKKLYLGPKRLYLVVLEPLFTSIRGLRKYLKELKYLKSFFSSKPNFFGKKRSITFLELVVFKYNLFRTLTLIKYNLK